MRAPAAAAEDDGVLLSSHFQPIFSLAHRRPVGFEGLIRARDPDGGPVSAEALFAAAGRGERRILLDRRCRTLHVESFMHLGDSRSWLFLNVDPYVAVAGPKLGSFFAGMLERAGLPAHRVAVELIEAHAEDEQSLVAAVEYYRDLGCLIVIDDFGAGYSNFDRIWRLKPHIVKIDREMTRRVTVEPLARRMFMGIVAVLHEAGALVCVEGIETEEEALCAVEANADLMQGNYFAPPAAELPDGSASQHVFARLFGDVRVEAGEFRERRRARLGPYLAALDASARAVAAGMPLGEVVPALLELECTQRCYLIAGDGLQIGENVEASRNPYARDPRLEPMRPTGGTSWQTKPYFRRAVQASGRIQITRPYLSVTGPRLCVTLSLAFLAQGELRVLCADLDFATLAGDDLSFGLVRA